MTIKRNVIVCLLLISVAHVNGMNKQACELVSMISKKEFLWDKYIDDRKKFFETMPDDMSHEERERLVAQKIVFNKELHREMSENIEVMATEMGIDPSLCHFANQQLMRNFQYGYYKS